MEPLQIADKLKELFPNDIVSVREFRDEVTVSLNKNNIVSILKYLHDDPSTDFDYLQDLCGMDYPKKKPRFEVVYHLYSIKNKRMLRLKALVPEDDCRIHSVTSIWKGADWHERECFDMFGIYFTGHPDLRRILMPEDWTGHPLRKDYPLKGPEPDDEWQGFKDLLVKAEKLKQYGWDR